MRSPQQISLHPESSQDRENAFPAIIKRTKEMAAIDAVVPVLQLLR